MPLLSPTFEFWFYTVSVFLFGLAFGSFLNVCIYRLPRSMSVIAPRSACPGCGASIAASDNIPVVSWFLLGGQCRHCHQPISSRYWLVELLTAFLFVASFWKFGLNLMTAKYCVFCFLVLGLIFTDADLKLLPDAMTLPGITVGLLFSLLAPVNGFGQIYLLHAYDFLPPTIAWRAISFIDACVGATVAAGFIWVIGALYERLRGLEALGFGDVKLMAMVGAFLGIKLALLTILLGSLSGSIAGAAAMLAVYRRRKRRWTKRGLSSNQAAAKASRSASVALRGYKMPFGIFLGGGALFSAFFGAPLLRWYMGWF